MSDALKPSGNLEILSGIEFPSYSSLDSLDPELGLFASSGYIPHVAGISPPVIPDLNSTHSNLDVDCGFGLLDVPPDLDIGAPVDVDMPLLYDTTLFTTDTAQKWVNFHPEFQCVIIKYSLSFVLHF